MKNKNRVIILIAATIVLFCLGFLYSWTLIKNYIELPGNPDISDVWLFIMLSFTVGIFLQGILPLKTHKIQKIMVIIATIVVAAGLFMSSFATAPGHLFICYGFMFGLGTGFLYNSWIAMTLRWFPDKGGFATGILLMGFGVTTFVFGFFATRLLDRSALGWDGTMRLMGLVILVVGLVGSLFFLESDTEAVVKKAKKMPKHQLSIKQMLGDSTFWFYNIWKMILKLVGLSMSAYTTTILYIVYANKFDLSLLGNARLETMEYLNYTAVVPTVLGTLAVSSVVAFSQGFFSVGNGFGRVPLGIMHDKIGVVKSLAVISCMNIVGLSLCIVGTKAESLPIVVIAILFSGLGYAGCAMEGPAFMNEVYGNKNVRGNMGVNALTTIPPIIIGSKIAQIIYNKTGELTMFFVIAIILCAISVLAVGFIPRGLKKLDKKYK